MSYEIRHAIRLLAGEKGLADFEKEVIDRWKDNSEYWEDVEKQAQKELGNLFFIFSVHDGRLGIYVSGDNDWMSDGLWVDAEAMIKSESEEDEDERRAIAEKLQDAAKQILGT